MLTKIKGDESITSADLSTDGSILAVSTMAELKLFRLRPKVDSLRVLKVDLSSEMAKTGAKSIHFSPDERWLAVIRFDDAVQLYRIRQSESPKQYPQILPKAVNLSVTSPSRLIVGSLLSRISQVISTLGSSKATRT